MKVISLAAALLVTPSNTVHLQHKAEFPRLPSGQTVANVIVRGLDEASNQLAGQLYVERQYQDYQGNMHSYERGFRKDIQNLQERLITDEIMKKAGIDWTPNVYPAKFLTDLVQAEFDDLVNQVRRNKEDLGKGIDHALRSLERDANRAGLAQTEAAVSHVRQALAQVKAKGRVLAQAKVEGPVTPPPLGPEGRQGPPRKENCWQKHDKWVPPACEKSGDRSCPGDCCWRAPKDEAEKIAFEKFWRDKWEKKRVALEGCMTKDGLGKDMAEALPPAAQMSQMFRSAVHSLSYDVARNTNQVKDMAWGLRNFNDALMGEASRLKVADTPKSLPDANDTAQKIVQYIGWFEGQLKNETSDATRFVDADIPMLRYGLIETAYRLDIQLEELTQGIDPVAHPEQVVKAIENAKREVNGPNAGRMFDDIARGMNDVLGTQASSCEVEQFASDSLDTLERVVTSPDFGRNVEGLAHEVRREAGRYLPRF